MRFATFVAGGDHHLGVVDGEEIADVTAVDEGLGPDLGAVLAAGRLGEVATAVPRAPRIPLQGATLVAPVLRPPKFLAIGLNYADHVAETGHGAAAAPALVQQAVDVRHRPGRRRSRCRGVSALVDYEGELAFVIGTPLPPRAGRATRRGHRRLHDRQRRDACATGRSKAPTMTIGKSFDTHGPMGPWIVTADELRRPARPRAAHAG